MQRLKLIISSLLIPIDYVMLVLAGIFVYYLRFSTLVELRPVIYEIPFKQYFYHILLIALVWLVIFTLSGLYRLTQRRHFSYEFLNIFFASSVGTMLIILVIFFQRELFSSRFIILAGWGMSIIFVSLGRIATHFIELYFYNRGKGLEPVLVFGAGTIAQKIASHLQSNPGLGYKVLARPRTVDELTRVWSSKAHLVESFISGDPHLSRVETMQLIDFCNDNHIVFRYAADIFGSLTTNVRTQTLAGIPIVTISKTALEGWGRIAKRLIDVIVSFVALVILLPVFFIIGVIIRIDSEGSIFVKLERVGARGKKFMLYKFRSMIKGAHEMKRDLLERNERVGPLFKIENDPRITGVGKYLRKSSLDELAQLFNVLKGEMSLVGPRPHEPQEVAKYQKHHKQLLSIKPGITGLAQISGRSKLSFEEEARLDIYYIENWSPLLDFQILLKTIPVVLSGKNVS
ncbi:sugar transferase [Patescibacteria group bacterium AH-259-L07]|nr:sugar transferase [Patescibacteria group bacterium AH-259-L07]